MGPPGVRGVDQRNEDPCQVVSPADYKRERTLRGTQESVAAQLGVDRVTIARRETGALPITREAELALLSLPKTKKRPSR